MVANGTVAIHSSAYTCTLVQILHFVANTAASRLNAAYRSKHQRHRTPLPLQPLPTLTPSSTPSLSTTAQATISAASLPPPQRRGQTPRTASGSAVPSRAESSATQGDLGCSRSRVRYLARLRTYTTRCTRLMHRRRGLSRPMLGRWELALLDGMGGWRGGVPVLMLRLWVVSPFSLSMDVEFGASVDFESIWC